MGTPTPPDDANPPLAPGELRLPEMDHDVEQLKRMMSALDELYADLFVPGTDFGPGRKGGKTVLLKPGAEKIFALFKLTAVTRVVDEECDYKGASFFYRVVCRAYDRGTGALVAEAMGACNSRESFFRDGDAFAMHNVCLKMAEKRAFVNCALRLGVASNRFTQDMEDLAPTASPSTIMAILDHIVHPVFSEAERKQTRAFVAAEPEPERATEVLDKMKERIANQEQRRRPPIKEPAVPAPAPPPPPSREATNEGPPPKTPDDTGDLPPADEATVRSMPERTQIALAYLKAGMSIIPLKPPGEGPGAGKAPLVKDWATFSSKLPTRDHVIAWWNRTPRANLGIVCGTATGVFVLDQDGEEGAKSLFMRDLPETPRVKTGAGTHYYFALPDQELRNAVKFMPGLDLRATGGQVVAPPSRHSNGIKYKWEVMPVELARALADIGIPYDGAIANFAEAPAWLLDELSARA